MANGAWTFGKYIAKVERRMMGKGRILADKGLKVHAGRGSERSTDHRVLRSRIPRARKLA